jgi:hypothetical protein
MNVRRLAAVASLKEEAERPHSKHSRHAPMLHRWRAKSNMRHHAGHKPNEEAQQRGARTSDEPRKRYLLSSSSAGFDSACLLPTAAIGRPVAHPRQPRHRQTSPAEAAPPRGRPDELRSRSSPTGPSRANGRCRTAGLPSSPRRSRHNTLPPRHRSLPNDFIPLQRLTATPLKCRAGVGGPSVRFTSSAPQPQGFRTSWG